MITIAKNLAEAAGAGGEIRAGGTDLQERRRSRIASGEVVDISRIPGLGGIDAGQHGETTIGALMKVAEVGRSVYLQEQYPALALPAQLLATPQIREVATMGGVLCQRNRCWYYRHPGFHCFRKGGDSCPARAGNHHFGVAFDLGPCVFPHPSSIGCALLTYDAEISVNGRERMTVAALYGDGSLRDNDHSLQPGEIITHLHLPAPAPGEKAGYFRLMSRSEAEWPLVEVVVRLMMAGDQIREARVGLGGVANIPLRLAEVEQALTGQIAASHVFEQAADLSVRRANPLPQTTYKIEMIKRSVMEALEQAAFL